MVAIDTATPDMAASHNLSEENVEGSDRPTRNMELLLACSFVWRFMWISAFLRTACALSTLSLQFCSHAFSDLGSAVATTNSVPHERFYLAVSTSTYE